MVDVETVFYRVENGTVCEFDLPLKDWAAGRAKTGVWLRVNADGTPWTPAPDQPPPLPDLPGRNDPKPAWIGYAVRVGGMDLDEAEAATKADLIDRFGGAP